MRSEHIAAVWIRQMAEGSMRQYRFARALEKEEIGRKEARRLAAEKEHGRTIP